MNFAIRGGAVALALLVTGIAPTAESVIERWHLNSFWESETMHGESLFFLEPEAGALATAPLLFAPIEIKSLVHTPTGATFEQGKDYTVDVEKQTITLTADSAIPFTTRADFEPPLGKTGQRYKDDTRDIFFAGGPLFHNLQVEITYTHAADAWTALGGPQPKPTEHLPAFREKLAAKAPVTICLLGDSISAGLDASSTSDTAPLTPPYGTLFSRALEERFGSPVSYTNYSVSGMATPWGIEQAPAVAEKKPDLVIIAFGMNDASGRMTPEQYGANTVAMMEAVRAIHPATSFVLVATMLGNDDWIHAASALYPQYRDTLLTLEGPGVAVADMTTLWTTLLEHKRFADITGNGVNHPNDFGHRAYAQTLLALFGNNPTE